MSVPHRPSAGSRGRRRATALAAAALLVNGAVIAWSGQAPARHGLGGADARELLAQLLGAPTTAAPVRLAAIRAAALARAAAGTDALVALLDDRTPRGKHKNDTVRVCDMAAAALEAIHRIHQIVPPGAYYAGPLATRDAGIARWKTWAAKRGDAASGDSAREAQVGRLLADSLKTLAAKPTAEQREQVRARLDAGLRLAFCMGDLPGVDAVVAPSVRDAWAVMRTSGEKQWYTVTKPWHSLEVAYRRQFLPQHTGRRAAPDTQAMAFIVFADGYRRFPKLFVWALCRNFAQVFPDSALVAKATAVQRQLEMGFRKDKRHVVVHGHIPVLEPLVRPAPPSRGMVAVGYTALWNQLSREPSNWAFHRLVIEHYRRAGVRMDLYPPFPQHAQLYRGSEYPFLGDAAYQFRVLKRPARALAAADNALILNPANAKAHAIRGIIRVVADREPEPALRDLRRAVELGPASLGDEPETLEAVVFLIGKTLAAGDRDGARAYAKALGRLRAFRAARPIAEEPAFQALARTLGAP